MKNLKVATLLFTVSPLLIPGTPDIFSITQNPDGSLIYQCDPISCQTQVPVPAGGSEQTSVSINASCKCGSDLSALASVFAGRCISDMELDTYALPNGGSAEYYDSNFSPPLVDADTVNAYAASLVVNTGITLWEMEAQSDCYDPVVIDDVPVNHPC